MSMGSACIEFDFLCVEVLLDDFIQMPVSKGVMSSNVIVISSFHCCLETHRRNKIFFLFGKQVEQVKDTYKRRESRIFFSGKRGDSSKNNMFHSVNMCNYDGIFFPLNMIIWFCTRNLNKFNLFLRRTIYDCMYILIHRN